MNFYILNPLIPAKAGNQPEIQAWLGNFQENGLPDQAGDERSIFALAGTIS